MTQTTEQIAAKLAQLLWQRFSQLIGHATLAYASHVAVANEERGFLSWAKSWLNPLVWLNPVRWFQWISHPIENFKKAFVWTTLEAITYPLQDGILQDFNTSTAPIAQGFLKPIIAKLIHPVVELLAKEGLISVHNIEQQTGPWTPLSFAGNLIWGTWNIVTWPVTAPWGVISNWWSGSAVPLPSSQTVYDILSKNAPIAGRYVADGIEYTANAASKMLQKPSDFIEEISRLTGTSYPVALVGTLAITGLAYLGARTSISNIVNMRTKVSTKVNNTATSTATGGQTNIYLGLPPTSIAVSKPDQQLPQAEKSKGWFTIFRSSDATNPSTDAPQLTTTAIELLAQTGNGLSTKPQ